MLLKGVFTTIVGLATIVGTYMYAVDNKWIDDVPDLRVASKTMKIAPPSAKVSDSKLSSVEKEDARAEERVRATAKRKIQRKPSKRLRRRTADNRAKRTGAKRRTVSIFKAAKDIPHPNTQR